MAASKDAQLDLTLCSICFEPFNRPKYLPCLHTFCEDCLQNYIASVYQTNPVANGINCPVCREFVNKQESIHVENWAKDFPVNHLIVSMIDMAKLKAEPKRCKPCSRANITENADSWCINCCEGLCKACVLSHRINKGSLSHKVISILEMETGESPLRSQEEFCATHPEERIRAYCADHSAVACMTCVMLTHRKCEIVVSVEEESRAKRSSEEFKELENSLALLKIDFETLRSKRDANMNAFRKSIADLKREVETLFTDITNHVTLLKEKTLQDINAAEKDVLPYIEDEKAEIDSKLSAIKNNISLLRSSRQHAAPANFLQSFLRISDQKCSLEKSLEESKRRMQNISIKITLNEQLKRFQTEVKSFCDISMERQKMNSNDATKVDMTSVSPELVQEINNLDGVTGIAFFNDDQILISGGACRVLRLQDLIIHDVSLRIPGSPWEIRMINETDGAVVISETMLLFFTIFENRIVKRSEFKVKALYSFVFHKGKYYIASGKEITVHDNDHRYLRTIPLNDYVQYIEILDDDTLLCGVGNILQGIKMNGSIVFKYSDGRLRGVHGITVDQYCNIYVCGYFSRNVHQLDLHGNLLRIMFDNLPSSPYCISFSKNYDKIAIGCDNKVLLYKLYNK